MIDNRTQALVRSNNQDFDILGTRLGFDRVHHYAEMLGLGVKAGLDFPGEQPGLLPLEEPKTSGVGMMTSFGTGISMTPLELATLLAPSPMAAPCTICNTRVPRKRPSSSLAK